MEDSEKDKMCAEAIHLWGINAQMLMVIEEAAELILSICKFYRSKQTSDDIANEIADNRVMARQLMHMTGILEDVVNKHEDFKWNRLQEKINVDKEKRQTRGKE